MLTDESLLNLCDARGIDGLLAMGFVVCFFDSSYVWFAVWLAVDCFSLLDAKAGMKQTDATKMDARLARNESIVHTSGKEIPWTF